MQKDPNYIDYDNEDFEDMFEEKKLRTRKFREERTIRIKTKRRKDSDEETLNNLIKED